VRKQSEEAGRLVEALRKYGVDWSSVGAQSSPPSLTATVTTDHDGKPFRAGETIHFTATVTNHGAGPAGQVRAQLKSDHYLYEEREFVFGRVGPGETRTWTIPVKVPKDTLPRLDVVKVQFSEENAHAPAPQELQVRLAGISRPRFAYSYQFIDDAGATNGDGLLQRGETARLRVIVKNTGDGKATKPFALLRNLSGDGVQVNKGRYEMQPLAPSEERTIDFTFAVAPDFSEGSARVELQVYDFGSHEGVTDKLTFPIVDSSAAGKDASGYVAVRGDTIVRSGASGSTPVVGKVKSGAHFRQSRIFGDFVRIDLAEGRPGFLPLSAVTATSGPSAGSDGALNLAWQVTPPTIEVRPTPLSVESNSIRLSATAKDAEQVIDAYVVVSNRTAKIEHRKVFYRSNRNGPMSTEMQIDAAVPLWPGVNFVSVVARQSGQVQAMQTLVINRLSKEPMQAAK
jgi:carboxyl-terminal processing protease